MPDAKPMPVACFAPPLTEEALSKYAALAETAPGPVRDAMRECLAAVNAWWDLPESKRKGERFKVLHRADPTQDRTEREVEVRPLENEHVKRLWDLVPWMYELNGMTGFTTPDGAYVAGIFDPLPTGDLRNAAYHLAWFCKELTLDREPLTLEVLK